MRDKTKIKLSQLIFIEYLQGITLFQEFSSLDNDAFAIYKHIPRYVFCELLKAQLESLSNNDSRRDG